MPRGFVYVTRSASPRGEKLAFLAVPTEWEGRLFFGPCKKPMRPRVRVGDWIFGITPAAGPRRSRRLVFAMEVEERITFSEAHARFPRLRGPAGPIHVRPVQRQGPFPFDSYEHVAGSAHPTDWPTDLAYRELDAFLVGAPTDGWKGRWLGPLGPRVDETMVGLLRRMSLHGASGPLAPSNPDATSRNPIAHGRLYTGLHLETDDPGPLLQLVSSAMVAVGLPLESLEAPPNRTPGANCSAPTRREYASLQPVRSRTTC